MSHTAAAVDTPIHDLLIVGGGINGAGIARDAAGRGLSVVLLEQDDLAAHTSSASTKLIHGGLRYLEYGEFRLVREALRERERLLTIAPHIIRPMRFVLPLTAALRPRWQIRIGLFVYDHSGGRRRLPASRAVRLAGTPLGAGLKSEHRAGFEYSDCWVDDARLVALNAVDAAEHGAHILTRTRLLAAERRDGLWHAQYEDTAGVRGTLRARAVVNAAGAWVTHVLRDRLGLPPRRALRLVKGSHIVVPRLYHGEHAYLLQNRDRRVVFAIPYEQHYTLVGTTDLPFDADPANLAISPAETRYLLATLRLYFTRHVRPAEVVHSYAGVRALLDDHARNASAVTRDYQLELDAPPGAAPVLSVFGGKITTYRRLAESALQLLLPHLGGRAVNPAPWTASEPLPGGDLAALDVQGFVARLRVRRPFLPASLAQRLAHLYGTRTDLVLGAARSLGDLGEDFGAGLTAAEVDYLAQHEWARTADDVLWRRTKLGLHAPPDSAARVARHLERAARNA